MPPDTTPQAPAPLSTMPPPNPEAGQHTIQSLAGRFRAKFPDGTTNDGIPYAKLSDDEMVRRVIQKQPVYQTWLSPDALQQVAAKGAPTFGSTSKEILGDINQSVFGGRTAGEIGSNIWHGAKNFFSEDPITRVSRGIDEALSDTQTAQQKAVASPNASLPLTALAGIPLVGPPAAGAVEKINQGLSGPTPLSNPSNPAYQGARELGQTGLSVGAAAKAGEAIPEAASNIKSVAKKGVSKIAPPPDVASGMAYENAVAPGGLGAAEQESLRSDWLRARKYIGAQTEKMPVPKGEGAVMRAAATTRKAANELWQSHVEPVIDKFAESSASTSDIADKVRDSLTDINRTKPGTVSSTNRFASVFDKDMTVREMNAKVTELNNDKSVAKFYDLDAAGQAQALQADPAVRGKVVALDSLREKMFDTISNEWTDEGGAMFREARKDYGSLRNVEQNFRDAKVPTPKPLTTRIANTARVSISPHAATEYLRNPVSTLLDLNNPNRLAAKAVNKAGQVGEGIPAPPNLPQYGTPIGPVAPQYSALAGPPAPPEQFPYAPAAPIPAPPAQPGFSPIQPPTPGTTGWNDAVPPVKQGAEQRNLWGRPVSTSSTETTPGGMITSSPPAGLVKQEFGKIGLSDLVTPRQSTTLETLMRGPRWRDMDRAERVAAVKDILSRK